MHLNPRDSSVRRNANFPSSQWTLVLAFQHGDSECRRSALSRLYEMYRYPLYAYVRRRGYNADDSNDLTQDFFYYLLEKNTIDVADQNRGRFRNFLLTTAENFLNNHWDKRRALKRGGAMTVSWDAQSAEERYVNEPVHELSPDKLYDYRCAIAVIEAAQTTLRAEYQRTGKLDVFDAMKAAVFAHSENQPYAEIARRLGSTEGAVKVLVHRMRQRYARLIREEIARTIESPADIEDERQALLLALETPGAKGCNFSTDASLATLGEPKSPSGKKG